MTQTVEIIEMLEDSPSLGKVAAQIAKELNIPVSVVIEMLPKIFENNAWHCLPLMIPYVLLID